MKYALVLLLLLADGQPPSSCQVTTDQNGVTYYSNCGPPSEHSGPDNASPS